MKNLNERALQDLQSLKNWANQLIKLSNEIVKEVECNDKDDLGRMAVYFSFKQINHMQSIVILVPNKDATLIARSMIEGLYQILWAANKPNEIPKQWRAFAYISDLQLIEKRKNKGEKINQQEQQDIEDGLRVYGDLFLKKKAKELKRQGKTLPSDPYHTDWRCSVQIKEIVESVQAEDLQEIYASFSDWHHWGPGGFSGTISGQRNKQHYSSNSPSDSATAITVGFLCLIQTVELLNNHLELGKNSEIQMIKDNYISWHKERKSSLTDV